MGLASLSAHDFRPSLCLVLLLPVLPSFVYLSHRTQRRECILGSEVAGGESIARLALPTLRSRAVSPRPHCPLDEAGLDAPGGRVYGDGVRCIERVLLHCRSYACARPAFVSLREDQHPEPWPAHLQRGWLRDGNHLCHPRLRQRTGRNIPLLGHAPGGCFKRSLLLNNDGWIVLAEKS